MQSPEQAEKLAAASGTTADVIGGFTRKDLLLFFPATEGVVQAIDKLGILLIGQERFEMGFESFHIFADFGEDLAGGQFGSGGGRGCCHFWGIELAIAAHAEHEFG